MAPWNGPNKRGTAVAWHALIPRSKGQDLQVDMTAGVFQLNLVLLPRDALNSPSDDTIAAVQAIE